MKMAKGAQLYNFRIDLSDIDNGLYELITYKSVLHPSEKLERMVIRSILFAIYRYRGVDFTKGVCVADEPDLWAKAEGDKVVLWVEIGLPSNDRLHKVCRDSDEVVLVLYGKSYNKYKSQKSVGNIHDHNMQIFTIDDKFVEDVSVMALKNNHWSIIVQDGLITLINGETSLATSLQLINI